MRHHLLCDTTREETMDVGPELDLYYKHMLENERVVYWGADISPVEWDEPPIEQLLRPCGYATYVTAAHVELGLWKRHNSPYYVFRDALELEPITFDPPEEIW